MQTWNVNVERQIGPALGVMAGYFGSHGDRLRITRNVNQLVNGVRPYPTLSPTSAILPGNALGNITETDSLGWSHYKGLWLTANERPMQGAAVQRLVHAGEVDRHQLAEHGGHRRAGQQQHRRQRGAVGFRRPAPVRRSTRSTSCRSRATALSRKAGSSSRRHAGADRQPGEHRHRHQHVQRREQHAAAGSRRRPVDHRIADAVVQQQRCAIRGSRPGPGRARRARCSRCRSRRGGAFHFGNLGRNAVLGPGFSNTDFSVIKNLDLLGGRARLQFRIESVQSSSTRRTSGCPAASPRSAARHSG